MRVVTIDVVCRGTHGNPLGFLQHTKATIMQYEDPTFLQQLGVNDVMTYNMFMMFCLMYDDMWCDVWLMYDMMWWYIYDLWCMIYDDMMYAIWYDVWCDMMYNMMMQYDDMIYDDMMWYDLW